MSIKILTVDDSKTIRLIVAKAFKPYDCTVLEADNGVVGLAVASREKPDLILLDYTMPVMDGFEVLGRLRSDSVLKSTPVIMLTAEAGRETVLKIAKLGVRDYLIKPFTGDLLVERAGRVVSLNSISDKNKTAKRYDDPLNLLVVDDKPAIVAQIRTALGDTPWNVTSAETPDQAVEVSKGQPFDLAMVSLALPNESAFTLFQNLRSFSNTASLPVLALCVKTATAEQTRAQQTGFTGILNKPIDPEELKGKICRTLKLETSYKYFQQREGWLALTLPKECNQSALDEISRRLDDELACIVDAGGNRLIVDASPLETASLPVIELIISAMQTCTKLSIKLAVVGKEAVVKQCRGYEETQSWIFAGNCEEAISLMK